MCFVTTSKLISFIIIKLFQKLVRHVKIKIALIVAALLIAVTGFCIYPVNSNKNVGRSSHLKSESPCEKE